MTIPCRIIQTGKTHTLSPVAKSVATNLKLLHPDWKYTFFDDDEVRNFVHREYPEYRCVFKRFPYPIQRVDLFRYLAIYRYGGFYFDLDVLLAQDLTGLIDDECVFPFEELTLNRLLRQQHNMDWEIGNYAFGAAPGHPFLEAVIENCLRAQRDPNWVKPMMAGIPRIFRSQFHVLNTTGPGLLSRTYAENPDIARSVTVLFPDDVCDTTTWHKFGRFGVHLMNGSWRPQAGFLHRRLAGWWESWLRRRLLRESIRLRPKRDSLGGATKREPAPAR
jgi:inositol phosphorylceramide mannosyltransferase catalytic subunit